MKKLLLTHMRLLTTLIISLMVSGCSYQTYLLVLNPHNESRRVTLQVDPKPAGAPIFTTRDLALYKLNKDEVDFSSHEALAHTELASLTLEIPARSALRIAVLRNEHYRSSEQNFLNGRIFNLNRLTAGTITVTRANFGVYFTRTAFGAAFSIP